MTNNPGILIFKFTADWCGPCKKIKEYSYTKSNELPDHITNISFNTDDKNPSFFFNSSNFIFLSDFSIFIFSQFLYYLNSYIIPTYQRIEILLIQLIYQNNLEDNIDPQHILNSDFHILHFPLTYEIQIYIL